MPIWEDPGYVDQLETLWNESPAEKEVIKKLLELVGPNRHKRVLDVGCGVGRLAKYFQHYKGLEPSKELRSRCLERGLDVEFGTIYKTGMLDREFSIVICNAVLHHAGDAEVAVRELWRVCSDRLIFSCRWCRGLKVVDKLVPSEDKEQGTFYVSRSVWIPRWMLKRLIKKLKPSSYTIEFQHKYAGEPSRVAYVLMKR